MVLQRELNFADRVTRKTVGRHSARRLIAHLATHPGWQTRAVIRAATGMSEREIRLARSAAHGRILFSQAGFRLTKTATQEEISVCLATFLSQIHALQEDYRQTAARAHRELTAQKGEK